MDFPKFGFEIRNAVDLAVDQFGGKVFSHAVLTSHRGHGCDSRNDNNDLSAGIIQDPKVLGLIGPICSSVAKRIVPQLNDAGVLVISPANTAPFLTDPESNTPFYFRTAPNDPFQTNTGAAFARQALGASTASILYYDGAPDDYSQIVRQSFKDAFTKEGGTVVGEFTVDFDQQDFSQTLDALGSVDTVYAALFFPEAITFFQQLRERDPVGDTAFIGTDAVMDGFLFEILGPDPVKMYLSGVNEAGPNHDDFVNAYLQKYGHEPHPFEALAYDATNLMLRAAAAVGHEDSRGNLSISKESLLQFMNDSGNYPYSGAASTYQTPVNGDLNPNGDAVFQAMGGDFVPIFP